MARRRPGTQLINASRGSVIDIDALAEALRSGHLAGAAVDGFPSETKGNEDPFESPLLGLDNVILTLPVGGRTLVAPAHIGVEVAAKPDRKRVWWGKLGSVIVEIRGTHKLNK